MTLTKCYQHAVIKCCDGAALVDFHAMQNFYIQVNELIAFWESVCDGSECSVRPRQPAAALTHDYSVRTTVLLKGSISRGVERIRMIS